MMDQLKPPARLTAEGNLDNNWKVFKQSFDLFMCATDAEDRTGKKKVAMLLTIAGREALELYNSFTFATDAEKDDYDEVIKKFDAHCCPKKNEVYERYVFKCRKQKQGENFDSFLTDLKLKAKTCNFDQLSDSLIRDQIVYGTAEDKVRERLLRETDLDLDKTVKICQAHEAASLHMKKFNEVESNTSTVNIVRKQKSKGTKKSYNHYGSNFREHSKKAGRYKGCLQTVWEGTPQGPMLCVGQQMQKMPGHEPLGRNVLHKAEVSKESEHGSNQ